MLYEVPNSHSKDKEVVLKLFKNEIWIIKKLKQSNNENDPKSDTIIFAGRVDTLQSCALVTTNEGGETGLALALTFYFKGKDTDRSNNRNVNR